jgi:hypothetical protein
LGPPTHTHTYGLIDAVLVPEAEREGDAIRFLGAVFDKGAKERREACRRFQPLLNLKVEAERFVVMKARRSP